MKLMEVDMKIMQRLKTRYAVDIPDLELEQGIISVIGQWFTSPVFCLECPTEKVDGTWYPKNPDPSLE